MKPHCMPWPTREHAEYVLRLYVTGMTPRSTRAISAVRAICEELLAGRYELEIIDVYQQPALHPRRPDRRHSRRWSSTGRSPSAA